ncbi:glycosyltransferase [Rubrobacter tropicus]|uniref:Glycosyltransferase n=1 Tax=Rubrobacter tropicus TaxID=2653851 RepID=A0A6G8Q7P3_9ACTN|nr:glycosyltransferase [Rubrobacter tropicus]QIN82495.1 glycosyltransferase [Rubrobacter tropicus]
MKVLMYSHDSYGLGHLRRTLALAEAFVRRGPDVSVLVLTGSTVSGTFGMSHGIDLVKLPSAIKVGGGEYEPSRMSVSFKRLKKLRAGLIRSSAESFDPDAFVVDKAPLGMKREVTPTLEFLRGWRPSTLTVLGLRDVMDDPARIRRNWTEGLIADAIEQFYDTILVYGPREVYDPLPEYGLSDATLERCHYVGYIGREPVLEEAVDLELRPGYVLVTAGGGGDGFRLMKNYVEGLRGKPPAFESIVVTGPMMDDGARRELEKAARGLPVRVLEFRADMERLVARAGAVVSMGGYNTTIELLVARKPALIVPRVEPRVEQLIRAERLSELGLVEMIHPDDLTPGAMRKKVEGLLRRGPASAPAVEVDLSGAARAVDHVVSGVAQKRSVAVGA